MKATFESRFNIEDKVYHVINPEIQGIIIEVRFCYVLKEIEYLVSTAIGTRFWMDEMELTLEKPFQL
ncbi:MAG: hypothetical protein WC222_11410 [Parachlamydiales bacterium]|jgi:hypothetical protein